jgi:hypothetical protein
MEDLPKPPHNEFDPTKKDKGSSTKTSLNKEGTASERRGIFSDNSEAGEHPKGILDSLGIKAETDPPKDLFGTIENDEKQSQNENDNVLSSTRYEAAVPDTVETSSEARETFKIAELSQDEQQTIAAEVVSNVEQLEITAQQAEIPEAVETNSVIETAAVQSYRNKIKIDGKDPETAATETINEFPEVLPEQVSPTEEDVEKDSPTTKQSNSRLGGASGASVPPPRAPQSGNGLSNNGNQIPQPFENSSHRVPTFAIAGAGYQPNLNNPNLLTNPGLTTQEYYRIRTHHSRGDFLLGVVVGDLLGRRKGRIKTERKVLPVQKRLEKNVRDLEHTIAENEIVVREAARKRSNEISRSSALAKPEGAADKHRTVAVEAKALHSKKAPEQIGKLLVESERQQPKNKPEQNSKTETARPILETTTIQPIDKHVETLNRRELLELAEKIFVEGSNLRQIYETHLVNEKGLRRLVAEHLSGGNVARQLRQEITERDIDFERDPQLRHKADSSTGGGADSLKSMVQHATQALPGDADDGAAKSAQAEAARASTNERKSSHFVADMSLSATVLILLSVVVYLMLIHH